MKSVLSTTFLCLVSSLLFSQLFGELEALSPQFDQVYHIENADIDGDGDIDIIGSTDENEGSSLGLR